MDDKDTLRAVINTNWERMVQEVVDSTEDDFVKINNRCPNLASYFGVKIDAFVPSSKNVTNTLVGLRKAFKLGILYRGPDVLRASKALADLKVLLLCKRLVSLNMSSLTVHAKSCKECTIERLKLEACAWEVNATASTSENSKGCLMDATSGETTASVASIGGRKRQSTLGESQTGFVFTTRDNVKSVQGVVDNAAEAIRNAERHALIVSQLGKRLRENEKEKEVAMKKAFEAAISRNEIVMNAQNKNTLEGF